MKQDWDGYPDYDKDDVRKAALIARKLSVHPPASDVGQSVPSAGRGVCTHCGRRVGTGLYLHERACAKKVAA